MTLIRRRVRDQRMLFMIDPIFQPHMDDESQIVQTLRLSNRGAVPVLNCISP